MKTVDDPVIKLVYIVTVYTGTPSTHQASLSDHTTAFYTTCVYTCMCLLTLGAHARGLRYLVCVCDSLSLSVCPAHESAQRSVQPKVPTASAQSGKHFKYGVFSKYKSYGVKKPTSLVRAYRDIIWRRWSDISPQIAKTEPFLVLSKSNGRLQATWQ